MELKKVFSRERLTNGIKGLGKLRIKTTHASLITIAALLLILFTAFMVRILPLRWEIQAGGLHLTEFDPYYQYSLTNYMVNHGLLAPYYPTQWVDTQRWYPDGINMGVSYPSLPFTAAVLYDITRFLGFNFDVMGFCSMLAAVLGTLGVLLMYYLGKEFGGTAVGLLSALFLALNPSVIQRSGLGWFDTELIAWLALPAFCVFFLRAIEEDRPITSSILYSFGSAAALAYFVLGWGASYYLVGLTVLFVFVLLLLKRYSRRLLFAYSITFGLGLLAAVSTRTEVGPSYVVGPVNLAVAGIFVLLVLNDITRNLTSSREKIRVRSGFRCWFDRQFRRAFGVRPHWIPVFEVLDCTGPLHPGW